VILACVRALCGALLPCIAWHGRTMTHVHGVTPVVVTAARMTIEKYVITLPSHGGPRWPAGVR